MYGLKQNTKAWYNSNNIDKSRLLKRKDPYFKPLPKDKRLFQIICSGPVLELDFNTNQVEKELKNIHSILQNAGEQNLKTIIKIQLIK
jgi:hypothetical protein